MTQPASQIEEHTMTETKSTAAGAVDNSPINHAADVFAAARWFETLWNSSAKAVSFEEIEWQCNTWGSGHGGGDWLDTALFEVVASRFEFRSWASNEGDGLVIAVPLDQFSEVARLIDRLGEDAESWPWFGEELEDDRERQIATAAEVLDMPTTELDCNAELLAALRIE
jgi:hypothetical protein